MWNAIVNLHTACRIGVSTDNPNAHEQIFFCYATENLT